MIYYPVGIPTLCRYEHFRRCVNSLAKNTHADKTELVIGLDFPPAEKYREGYEQINQYIDQIQGFAKVTVFRHEKNLGAMENWRFINQYIFEHYDAAIMTEDDNEFSPCFLDFVNKSLLKYKSNSKVASVSGTSHPKLYEQGGKNCYFYRGMSAWGVGLWREKEDRINKFLNNNDYFIMLLNDTKRALRLFFARPAVFGMLVSMVSNNENWGDVKRVVLSFENDTYQLRPAISLVRNWGQDGSGLHSGVHLDSQSIMISSNREFDIECDVAGPDEPQNLNMYKHATLPEGCFKRNLSVAKIFISYIKYRIGL